MIFRQNSRFRAIFLDSGTGFFEKYKFFRAYFGVGFDDYKEYLCNYACFFFKFFVDISDVDLYVFSVCVRNFSKTFYE